MKQLDENQRCDLLIGGWLGQPGDKCYRCCFCHAFCWLAPSGQRRMDKWPDTKVACFPCGLKAASNQNALLATASKEEIAADIRGGKERAERLLAESDDMIERAMKRLGIQRIQKKQRVESTQQ